MARHNDLIGHNTSPDRNKPNPSPNRPHAAEPTRKALVTRESNLSCNQAITAGWFTARVGTEVGIGVVYSPSDPSTGAESS